MIHLDETCHCCCSGSVFNKVYQPGHVQWTIKWQSMKTFHGRSPFFFFLIFCHICEHGVFTVKKWWPHSPTYSLNYLKKQTKYSIFLCMMHVHLQQNLKNKMNVCLDDRFCCRCFTIHTPSPLSVLVPNNLLQNCQQIVEVVMIKAKLLNYLVPVLSFFILILVLLLGCVQLM